MMNTTNNNANAVDGQMDMADVANTGVGVVTAVLPNQMDMANVADNGVDAVNVVLPNVDINLDAEELINTFLNFSGATCGENGAVSVDDLMLQSIDVVNVNSQELIDAAAAADATFGDEIVSSTISRKAPRSSFNVYQPVQDETTTPTPPPHSSPAPSSSSFHVPKYEKRFRYEKRFPPSDFEDKDDDEVAEQKSLKRKRSSGGNANRHRTSRSTTKRSGSVKSRTSRHRRDSSVSSHKRRKHESVKPTVVVATAIKPTVVCAQKMPKAKHVSKRTIRRDASSSSSSGNDSGSGSSSSSCSDSCCSSNGSAKRRVARRTSKVSSSSASSSSSSENEDEKLPHKGGIGSKGPMMSVHKRNSSPASSSSSSQSSGRVGYKKLPADYVAKQKKRAEAKAAKNSNAAAAQSNDDETQQQLVFHNRTWSEDNKQNQNLLQKPHRHDKDTGNRAEKKKTKTTDNGKVNGVDPTPAAPQLMVKLAKMTREDLHLHTIKDESADEVKPRCNSIGSNATAADFAQLENDDVDDCSDYEDREDDDYVGYVEGVEYRSKRSRPQQMIEIQTNTNDCSKFLTMNFECDEILDFDVPSIDKLPKGATTMAVIRKETCKSIRMSFASGVDNKSKFISIPHVNIDTAMKTPANIAPYPPRYPQVETVVYNSLEMVGLRQIIEQNATTNFLKLVQCDYGTALRQYTLMPKGFDQIIDNFAKLHNIYDYPPQHKLMYGAVPKVMVPFVEFWLGTLKSWLEKNNKTSALLFEGDLEEATQIYWQLSNNDVSSYDFDKSRPREKVLLDFACELLPSVLSKPIIEAMMPNPIFPNYISSECVAVIKHVYPKIAAIMSGDAGLVWQYIMKSLGLHHFSCNHTQLEIVERLRGKSYLVTRFSYLVQSNSMFANDFTFFRQNLLYTFGQKLLNPCPKNDLTLLGKKLSNLYSEMCKIFAGYLTETGICSQSPNVDSAHVIGFFKSPLMRPLVSVNTQNINIKLVECRLSTVQRLVTKHFKAMQAFSSSTHDIKLQPLAIKYFVSYVNLIVTGAISVVLASKHVDPVEYAKCFGNEIDNVMSQGVFVSTEMSMWSSFDDEQLYGCKTGEKQTMHIFEDDAASTTDYESDTDVEDDELANLKADLRENARRLPIAKQAFEAMDTDGTIKKQLPTLPYLPPMAPDFVLPRTDDGYVAVAKTKRKNECSDNEIDDDDNNNDADKSDAEIDGQSVVSTSTTATTKSTKRVKRDTDNESTTSDGRKQYTPKPELCVTPKRRSRKPKPGFDVDYERSLGRFVNKYNELRYKFNDSILADPEVHANAPKFTFNSESISPRSKKNKFSSNSLKLASIFEFEDWVDDHLQELEDTDSVYNSQPLEEKFEAISANILQRYMSGNKVPEYFYVINKSHTPGARWLCLLCSQGSHKRTTDQRMRIKTKSGPIEGIAACLTCQTRIAADFYGKIYRFDHNAIAHRLAIKVATKAPTNKQAVVFHKHHGYYLSDDEFLRNKHVTFADYKKKSELADNSNNTTNNNNNIASTSRAVKRVSSADVPSFASAEAEPNAKRAKLTSVSTPPLSPALPLSTEQQQAPLSPPAVPLSTEQQQAPLSPLSTEQQQQSPCPPEYQFDMNAIEEATAPLTSDSEPESDDEGNTNDKNNTNVETDEEPFELEF